MDPDPLQRHWDGVNNFQTKFNNLRTRAIRNFKFEAGTSDSKKNLLFGSSGIAESARGALQIAPKHRKRYAKRRRLKANAPTPP
jgi:hypothetical protein